MDEFGLDGDQSANGMDFAESLIRSAQAIMIMLDTRGKVLHLNAYAEKALGWRLGEIHGKDWFDIFVPANHRESLRKQYFLAIRTQTALGSANPVILRNGKQLLVKWYDEILKEPNGSVRGMISIGHDITEQKQAEESLRKSKAHLQTVLDSIPDLIFQIDPRMIIQWANKKALDKNPDVIGKPCRDVFAGIDSPCENCYCRQAIISGKIETMIQKQTEENGETYWDCTAVPLLGSDGRTASVIAIVRNVTESMISQRSQSMIASIVELSDDAIVNYAPDGSVINWNSGAERIFGYSASEMKGNIAYQILCKNKDSELKKQIDRVAKGEHISNFEFVYSRKDGKQIYIDQSMSPIKNDSGNIIGIAKIARDITESKKMQEALHESELFNKTIISSVGEGIFVADREKRIKVWNKTMEEITGLRHSEVEGKKISDLFSDYYKNGMDKHFNKAFSGEIVYLDDTLFHIAKNNTEGWITGTFSPHISANGEIIGIVATIRDISRRRMADEALKRSEARYKGLFENMSSGLAVYEAFNNGRDFIFKDFNLSAENIEKTSKEKLLGRKLSEFMDKIENAGFYETLQRVLRTGKPENIVFNLTKEGMLLGRRSNYIYKLPTGELVSIFSDVTESYQAEAALKESEERYRSFVQNFRGIAFRRQLNFEPIFLHGSVEEITGYTTEEFSDGRLMWNNIIHEGDLQNLMEQYNKLSKLPGYEYNLEYRIIRRDGQIRWVQEHLQNISGDSGLFQFFQGTIYNINERREAEEALRRSREQLRNFAYYVESAREEERKHIAFEVHDELGHLLTALKLDLSWLLNKRYIKQDVLVEKIQEMSKHIDAIIRKVRSISSQLRPSVLDHFGLVAAIEWQAAEFQKRTAIRCRLQVPQNEISLEERRSTVVFRIFQEILTNITRHAQATRVDVTFEQSGSELVLRVVDNGRGIEQEKINSKKSFGLIGLQEKANFMGGRVTINGIIGFGTTVTLYIPLKQKDTFND